MMNTPYEILAVSENASDSEIKKAYLAKVRQYPPERFSELFQQIRHAYELIKTEEDRLSYSLFDSQLPKSTEIAAVILGRMTESALPTGKELKKTLSQDLQDFCVSLEF